MRSNSDTVETKTALVVGASGIAGSALVDRLADEGWDVVALSRNPIRRGDVRHVSADLNSLDSLREALAGERPSHVFYTAWSRMNTEQENIETNAAMLRNLLASRPAGFNGYRRTEDSFIRLFDRCRADRLIPAGPPGPA